MRPGRRTTSSFMPAGACLRHQLAASSTAASIWPFEAHALSKCGDLAGIFMYSTSEGTMASSQNCAMEVGMSKF